MNSQMACLRRGIVTLVAFVWLFSTVRFQMCPQMACPRRSKVTLVAFVWLVSIVRFHMSPQMACPWGCKVTLVAFVSLFPTDDNVYCDDKKILGQLVYLQKPKQLWKLSKLITNGTNKEKTKISNNSQTILIWKYKANTVPKNTGIPGFCKNTVPYRTGIKFLIPLEPAHVQWKHEHHRRY